MVPGSKSCQENPWPCHAGWWGRAGPGPLCCLIVKPHILRGGHGAVHAHWGSRTNEKKRGQFLVMSLITGFCSILNWENVSQALSLKAGPAHERERKKKKKRAENKLRLHCLSEIQAQEITIAVKEGSNGTYLFLSVKTIWSKWKQTNKKLQNLPLVLWCSFKRWKAHWWTKISKTWQKEENSYTVLIMEFANNVSQDSSLQNSVISTFSQCSQQKFLIHNAWIPSEKKKEKRKKNHKNTNFFLFKK